MALIRIRRAWELPEREATDEGVYRNRRRFIRSLGLGGIGALGLLKSRRQARGQSLPALYPAPQNPKFRLDRPLTPERVAAHYNNFYEFSAGKDEVYRLVERFQIDPWRIDIVGEVEKPITVDAWDLIRKMPLEERLYRFRCVEAWAMAVPWTGFPMKKLVEFARPRSTARYLRMVAFLRPWEAPGQKRTSYFPWPYQEGLRLAEATNELALMVTGIYGHPLPRQHGSPLRLMVPWKYGLKSIKSIVRFEFTRRQPSTFWNTVAPDEYDFLSNVNPAVPHPRWSQAYETMIGSRERRPTRLYNGYGEYVAHLYP